MAMSEHAYFRTDETTINKFSSSSFTIERILGKQTDNCEEVPPACVAHDSPIVSSHEKYELESENDIFPCNETQSEQIRIGHL